MIEFLWPWALVALPLPIIVYTLVAPASRDETALFVPFFSLISHYSADSSENRRNVSLRRLLIILIWLLLVLDVFLLDRLCDFVGLHGLFVFHL